MISTRIRTPQQATGLLEAELDVERDEHLAVGTRVRLVGHALLLEEIVELLVVVNFAIGRDDDRALLNQNFARRVLALGGEERLRAGLGVDDG